MAQLKLSFSKIKKFSLVLDLIFGIILLGIVLWKTDIWFETNDDHYIMDILMGQVTGGFEYRVRVCSPIFTMPLALLYQILPSVPWYGILMLICHLMVFMLPLYFAREHVETVIGNLLCYVVAGSLFVGSWYVQSRVQFTSTAALLATMGFFCYLMSQEKKGLIAFGAMELTSYGMRPDAMEMIQLIGFCVLIGCLIVSGKKKKEVIHNILYPLTVSLCIIIAGIGIGKLSFWGNEWKEAEQINQARIEMMDYYGVPATEEVQDILDSYEISGVEYEGFKHYLILDYRTMKGALNDIASYAKTNYREKISIGQIIKWVYIESYGEAFHGLNLVELWMLIFAVGTILISKQYKKILIIFIYAFGKGIVWGYIYSQGRLVNRVVIPLYLTEIVLLLAIGISMKKEITNRILVYIYGMLLVPACIMALLTGRSQLRDFSVYTDSYRCLERTEQEITEYCNQNMDKKYIVSDSLSRNWKRTVWDTSGGRDNYVYSGGWFSFAPPVQEWMDTYLDGTDLYLITTQEDVNNGNAVEHNFFSEYYGEDPEQVDSIPLSTGSYALVYRVH